MCYTYVVTYLAILVAHGVKPWWVMVQIRKTSRIAMLWNFLYSVYSS